MLIAVIEHVGLPYVRQRVELVLAPVRHGGGDNARTLVEALGPCLVSRVMMVGLPINFGYRKTELGDGFLYDVQETSPLGTVPLNYSTCHISHTHHDEPNNILLAQ